MTAPLCAHKCGADVSYTPTRPLCRPCFLAEHGIGALAVVLARVGSAPSPSEYVTASAQVREIRPAAHVMTSLTPPSPDGLGLVDEAPRS